MNFDAILLFGMPGGAEWILIFIIVLLLFGGKKIPELMRGLGSGIRQFNDARKGAKEDTGKKLDTPDKPGNGV